MVADLALGTCLALVVIFLGWKFRWLHSVVVGGLVVVVAVGVVFVLVRIRRFAALVPDEGDVYGTGGDE